MRHAAVNAATCARCQRAAPAAARPCDARKRTRRLLPQVLVVTQGAKLGTRRYLPCYDAPARKANFTVTAKASPCFRLAASD